MATTTPFTTAPEGTVDVVVNKAAASDEEARTKPDDSCGYWLSCICCNCFGLGFIAFIFHYVAKSLFEAGANQKRAANNLWKRARWFRKMGVSITIIALLFYMAYIGLMFFKLCPYMSEMHSDDEMMDEGDDVYQSYHTDNDDIYQRYPVPDEMGGGY